MQKWSGLVVLAEETQPHALICAGPGGTYLAPDEISVRIQAGALSPIS